ncbi:hypothetical protein ACFRIC_39275 [Streptomyces sp. NPDC056738]
MNRLVPLSRQAGDLVVWVLHSPSPVPATSLTRLPAMEELERAEGV